MSEILWKDDDRDNILLRSDGQLRHAIELNKKIEYRDKFTVEEKF